MTTDPDILAIQRRRRQQRRCLICGVTKPGATLCVACRAAWRYCPMCERVYPLDEAYLRARSPAVASDYCRPCGYRVRSGPRTPRADYLDQQHARRHPHLRAIIQRYRRGLTLDAIAAELGMSLPALQSLIRHARTTGRWPNGLARGKDWRKRRSARPAIASDTDTHGSDARDA